MGLFFLFSCSRKISEKNLNWLGFELTVHPIFQSVKKNATVLGKSVVTSLIGVVTG